MIPEDLLVAAFAFEVAYCVLEFEFFLNLSLRNYYIMNVKNMDFLMFKRMHGL